MIIYLRHGEDAYENPTFAHDQKIPQVEEIHDDIEKVGKFLVVKYGQPTHVICSPFQRARDTYNILKRKAVLSQETKLLIDTRVGRYFSSKEKKDGPEVRKETKKMKPSIYESWESFKVRVRNHVNQLKDDKFLKSRHTTVWVITHTLVIKEVARYLRFEMPEYYEFLQWVALRSHGPEHKISFIAMGDGAKDPEVLQEDVKRKKGAKREVVVKKEEESDSGFEDDHSGYDDSGNLVLVAKGGREIMEVKKDVKVVEKKVKKQRKMKEEKKDEKKERRPGPPQPKPKEEVKKKIFVARIATLDDHINLNVKKKEAEIQKKKEERGKPLDVQMKEHFKATQSVTVKDKYETAKGGNLDDFIKAYEGNRTAK